jgi:hypothetical protein
MLIEDAGRVNEMPPEFTSHIRDISIHVGEPVTFDCQFAGQPRPEVAWLKV